MTQIQKATSVEVIPQTEQGFVVLKTDQFATLVHKANAYRPSRTSEESTQENQRGNEQYKRILVGCAGVAVVLSAVGFFVDAVTPEPPAPAPVIRVVPAPTPTPAPTGNNQDCIENCYSIF